MSPRAVPYPYLTWVRSLHSAHHEIHTDVASDPVLQTVRTLSSFPVPPPRFTRSINQFPPNLDIILFRPTSSSATFFPSAMRSCAMVLTLLPWPMDADIACLRRRVAAPRLTAVGRAGKRESGVWPP